MQLIRGIYNIKNVHRGCVATIGNFDGVHIGHQTILATLKKQAIKLNVPLCVITFEPSPQEYLNKDQFFVRLTNLREKLALLNFYGVDQVLCLPFDAKLKNMSADAFVDCILVQGLNVRYLMIGDDFQYGINRLGNFLHLQQKSIKYQFCLKKTMTIVDNNQRVSSTWIRALLHRGQLKAATKLLGHPYAVVGRVVQGQKIGRKLGFPTANIAITKRNLALKGVFFIAVWLKNNQNEPYYGVANIGVRPSFGMMKPLLEAHLFNFDGNLYHKILRIVFIEKIRDTQKFSTIDDLQQAIRKDVMIAYSLLNNQLPIYNHHYLVLK